MQIMKKIFLILFSFCLGYSLINAQNTNKIGVNTDFPKSIFHIDAFGDNQTANPTANQLLNDVVVTTNTSSEVIIGIGGDAYNSAQLSLNDPHKALLLNRLNLKTITDLSIIKNPEPGMMVFNLAPAGTFPDNVNAGVNYYSGQRWFSFLSGSITSSMNFRDLLTSVSSTSSAINSISGATQLNFDEMKITEEGYYSFSLRLFGDISSDALWRRTSYYIYLVKGSQIVDAIEINIPMFGSGESIFYNAFLRGHFNKNEVATIYIAHKSTAAYPWKLKQSSGSTPDKTTLTFWKG